MKKSQKHYEKEEIEKIIKNNLSIASVCRDIGIRPVGGNYKTVHYYIDLYNIDISHFTGKAWNVGTRYRQIKKSIPLSEILIENSTYTSTGSLKKRLIGEGILEEKCDECNITEWNGKKLSLHLDHINGNNRDNRIENLRLLCPNCHSQTDTYCSSKTKNEVSDFKQEMYIKYKDTEIENNYCECGKIIQNHNKQCMNCFRESNKTKQNYCKCGKSITKNANMCESCYKLSIRKVERPSLEQLLQEIKETNYLAVGKKYGVSDSAIRKWIRQYQN